MDNLWYRVNQLVSYELVFQFIFIQENLPQKMDHKRLEQALSKYGTIAHISLPRFKNNKEFKGFGFIEFEKVEEAEKALEVLTYPFDHFSYFELGDPDSIWVHLLNDCACATAI